MKLFFLRHGEAENYAITDEQRQLTAKGQQDVTNVAQQFARKAISIDRCLVSPFRRAQQTAELFAASQDNFPEIETSDILVPETRASELIHFLDKQKQESILLVSHNPLMSELLALLKDAGIQTMEIVGTSELNALNIEFLGLGSATQLFRLTPNG